MRKLIIITIIVAAIAATHDRAPGGFRESQTITA